MAVPRLMCTQHPDTTIKMTVNEEVDEALVDHLGFNCDEVMVDFEGKTTPYNQPKEVVIRAIKANIKLGEEFYITIRMPNPRLEELERSLLAMEAGLVANYYSWKYIGTQAVRWFVLPMVNDVETLALTTSILIKKAKVYTEDLKLGMDNVEIVPLIEHFEMQVKVDSVIEELYKQLSSNGSPPERLRVFLGKSDAAVYGGHVASSLSIQLALSKLESLSRKLGIKIFPIIGMGSPPFRGALNNYQLVDFETFQYAGYYTATIQSAIRYDVDINTYHKVSNTILSGCCKRPRISAIEQSWIERASSMYRYNLLKYVDKMLEVAKLIPSTRDRVSWTMYGREVANEDRSITMPRAIVFTSAWYAMGLPPTFLDADFIREAYKKDELDSLLKALPVLVKEWEFDAQYYSPEVVGNYLNDEIVKSIDEALDILGIKERASGPYLTLLKSPRNEANVIALGKLRKFLG